MTVAIPEAAGAAEGTAARVLPARSARARPARAGSGPRYRPRHAAPPPAQSARPARKTAPGPQAPGDQPAGRKPAPDDKDRAGEVLSRSGAYHRVVIAEFVATIVIIGMSPFLVPRTDSSASPESEAKAAVRAMTLSAPLVRLTAACIVFFVLALLSTGRKTGKIAAAFGALVTLGALINATDMWTAVGQVFAGAQARKTVTPDTGLGAATAAAAGGAVG